MSDTITSRQNNLVIEKKWHGGGTTRLELATSSVTERVIGWHKQNQ